MTRPQPRKIFGFVVAVALLGAPLQRLHAAPATPEAARRTVGIYTYYTIEGKLLPARNFTGILINAGQIATSAWALTQPPTDLSSGTQRAVLAQVFAVASIDGKPVVLSCHALDSASSLPVTLLEVAEADREKIANLADKPVATAALTLKSEARVVGVVAPDGLSSDGLATGAVPAPVSMRLKIGEKIKFQGVDGASVDQTLPGSMIGGGVWNTQDQLIGFVTRFQDALVVSDLAAFTKMLSNPGPVVVRPPVPENPVTPETPKVKPPDETAGPAVPRSLKGLIDMVKQEGLTLQLDASLLDFVKQDQADLVMAKIAGGKPADAVKMLNDIEPLSSGTLAEQLNYRRALALLMLGKYTDARARAEASLTATDELVNTRGHALFKVLDEHPDGQLDGKPLSDPKVLADSMRVKGNEDVAKQLDLMFAAAKNTQLVSTTSFDLIEQRVQAVLKRIDAARQSKQGNFDSLYNQVTLFQDQLLRKEYARANAELVDIRQKYQDEVKQAEFKQGADWSKAGYWPEARVGKANVLADRYNDLLVHLSAIADQLDAAERQPLKGDAAKPLERLLLAKRIDRR
jgi:hypothetical protein